MSMYFPFESMSRAISGPSVLVGAGLLSDGCCVLCWGTGHEARDGCVSCLGRVSLSLD